MEVATNLDDMSPEKIAHLVDLLLESGALDVWQTPATFKKGRLGCVLSALILREQQEAITDLIFRHSTTLGIRWRTWNRTTLVRSCLQRETPLGPVRVKTSSWKGKVLREKVEYDDLNRLSREHHVPLSDLEDMVRE